MARAGEKIEKEISAYFAQSDAPADGDGDGSGDGGGAARCESATSPHVDGDGDGSGDGGGAARCESTTSPHVWAVVTKAKAEVARAAQAAGATDTFVNSEFKLIPVSRTFKYLSDI